MDFMKLFGTVLAVFFHPGSASKINGKNKATSDKLTVGYSFVNIKMNP